MLHGHKKDNMRWQFNHLFQLGVVESGDLVDNESQRLSGFEDVKQWLCILPNYRFIWEKLQYIHHCMYLCQWKLMVHLGWIGNKRMMHTYYKSLQIYCIIIQWHYYLGYHIKQKICGICVSQMQGGGKYCNVIGIPICRFKQRNS